MGCGCVFVGGSNATDVAIEFADRAAEGKSVIDNVVVVLVTGLEVSKLGKLKAAAFEGEEVHHPQNLLRGQHSVANSLLGNCEFVAVKASALDGIHQLAKVAFEDHVVGAVAIVGSVMTGNYGRSIVETTLGMAATGSVVDTDIGILDGYRAYTAVYLDGSTLSLVESLLSNVIFEGTDAGVVVEGAVHPLEVLGISDVIVGKFCVSQFGAFVTKLVHDVPYMMGAKGMVPAGLLSNF